MKEKALLVLSLVLLAGCGVYAQDSSRPRPNETATPSYSGSPSQAPIRRPAWHEGDIVADNLDRVAATAEQIVEILNREAGLMVELKRQIAEDAGENGQILEESDLTETAIIARLHEDLHTRVLATKLLRAYGYLVPKLNPDSNQAQEQKLLMQARAQELAREQERNSPLRGQAPEQWSADCDANQPDCNFAERRSGVLQTHGRPASRETYPVEQAPPGANDFAIPEGPDGQPAPREPRIETAEQSLSSPHLAAYSPTSPGGASLQGGRNASGISQDSLEALSQSANESLAISNSSASPSNAAGEARTGARDFETRYAGRTGASGSLGAFEPVRMVHRPNPYADVPSLYDLYVQANAPVKGTERFGLELFRHGKTNSEVLPMDLPVGPDYVLGPGDSLAIDLWGGVSQRLFRVVDREGRLLLPEAGPLLVSGKSLGEVQAAVQRTLRTQFRDVSADVSLLKLRTVRVYVVGEVVAPGAYDVSSLSTPLNALFAAGGVTSQGSLRRLEHYRGNQLLEEVDAYDLLLHGIRGDAKRLENGDSLRVPPLGPSVTVDGMVRRPAVYELREEKNLSEVLELAGGLLPAAALRHVEVQRLEAHEKHTMLSLQIEEGTDKQALRAALDKFSVRDGDEIHIFPIAPYNTQAVYLEGHVLRPGRYAYREGMKLTDLIPSPGDLLPEPSERYAEIIRLQAPENRPKVVSFSLEEALAHPETAPKLQPLDTVRVFGRYELEPAPEFTIFGEVRRPGRYRSSGQAHLRDAIYQAGGVTPEAWEESAQLFRVMPGGSTRVFSISLRSALAGDPLNNILVEPRDRILVHRQPERVDPPSVTVRGEVARPGRYPLTANMKVSDLIRSAGGLLRSADPENGDLTRYETGGLAGSSPAGQSHPVKLVAGAWDENADLCLHDGDVLTVPQRAGWKNLGASVTLTGEVAKPGVYGIQPGERLSSLLRRAGGLLPTAYPQAAVFERVDVRKMQEQSRQELIQRLEQESVVVKTTVTASGSDEAALQQSASQQRQRILDALRRAPISGRLVVHLRQHEKGFAGSPDDVELRAGDTLEIPEQPGFVVIVGQVYNSNAISYSPGKNAGWYLSRAGGATAFANKKAVFIIRANGSVTSGGDSLWSGGVLSSPVGPGDTIVVPEKAVMGGSGWKNAVSIAQIAQAAALAAAVAIP